MPETLSQPSNQEARKNMTRAINRNKISHESFFQTDKKTGFRDEFVSNEMLPFAIALKHKTLRWVEFGRQDYEKLKARNGFKNYSEMFPEDQDKGALENKKLEKINELNEKVRELWQTLVDIYENESENQEVLDRKIDSFQNIFNEIDDIVRYYKQKVIENQNGL